METASAPAKSKLQHYAVEAEFPMRLRFMRWLGRQTWIPRGTDRILRTLHHPDHNRHYLFEVDFFGKRYRGDLAHFMDWSVFCYGCQSLDELNVLRAATGYLRDRNHGRITFFDIGANVGHHSLFMYGLVERIIAFEPYARTRAIFEEQIRLNGMENIEVLPFALGEQDCELKYFVGVGANSGIGTFIESNASQTELVQVLPVRRGDTLFDEMKFPAANIIKLDVEGFELYVLRGLSERIRRDRPIILTEISDAARAVIGNEDSLRSCFYDGAIIAELCNRAKGTDFSLLPFDFNSTSEALIVPPEMADFVARHTTARS